MTPAPSHRALRICFVAPDIYPMLAGSRDIPVFGGSQFRQAVLARAFAAAGCEVSVVTMDFGQPHDDTINGVRVLKTHTPAGGIPVLRYFHPRLTSFVTAMSRARADIYFQTSASHLTAVLAWHCRRSGARAIYSGASDTDFMRGHERVANARDRWLFRRGLAQVDAVVVQSVRQAELLRANYRREGHLIPNPYTPPPRKRSPSTDLILWVGGIREVKRPDRFIALARSLPQYRFCMIGGAVGGDAAAQAYHASIRGQAAAVSNLDFLGYLPLQDVEPYFDEARVFVNTSEHEGFPNTFLQAWSRGIPTVSYFDSGTDAQGLRPLIWVQDEAGASAALSRLMSSPGAWESLSSQCALHYQRHHTTSRVVAQYLALFADLRRDAKVIT